MTTTSLKKRLLIVGPLPPPIGGSSVTVQSIVEELARNPSIQVTIINTSPSLDPRKKMIGVNLEKIRRTISIIPQYIMEIRHTEAVLVFANNLFAFTIVPILLFLAKCFRKPFYLKPVGGDLDLFITAQKNPLQKLLLSVIKSSNGVLAQTHLLQEALISLGCTNTYFLPGCRPFKGAFSKNGRNSDDFRIIFLAYITREKGALILMEALQNLEKTGLTGVTCDFYGSIHDEIRDEFLRELDNTSSARYCGEAEAGSGTHLIAKYDALVLPTSFVCEGHTGVIIEAMHAGVPVISTQHRAIPELITNGENGILVPTHDSHALATAIIKMSLDRSLRERMGKANYQRGLEFRSEKVISQMLEIIFPGLLQ